MEPGVVGAPVRDVVFEERRVLLVLEDGRALAAPIGWLGATVAGWDVGALAPRTGHWSPCGGSRPTATTAASLQFLGNWGTPEVHAAFAALAEVDAQRTLEVLREFWDHLAPVTESDDVSSMDDVLAVVMATDLPARLDALDGRFRDAAEELITKVPSAYGPARSAIRGGAVG